MFVIKRVSIQFKKIIKNENGSLTLQMYLIILVSMIIILGTIAFLPVIIKYQNLVYVTKKVVQDVEYTGEINSETYELLDSLADSSGINPGYKWEGDISSRNRIQLRNRFKLTLSDEVSIKIIQPSFTDPIVLKIPISKTLEGESQTYWKPGTE